METKAKEHMFDISTKEKRREATGSIATILYEIYMIEEDNYQELLYFLEFSDEDESGKINSLRYIMDELLDLISILANLYYD